MYNVDEIIEDKANIEKCLYPINTWGQDSKTKRVRAEVFFEIVTSTTVQEIFDNTDVKNYTKENKIRLSQKRTKNEHTMKIGFITGMYIEGASTRWYNQKIASLINVEHDDIELGKRTTWQKSFFVCNHVFCYLSFF